MPENPVPSLNTSLASTFLLQLLSEQLSDEQYQWLRTRYDELKAGQDSMDFHLSFGAVSRFIPREFLSDQETYKAKAEDILKGWSPHLWTKETLARVLLLTGAPIEHEQGAYAFIWDAFDTADMWEQVAIFSALPVLPFPESYTKIAAEGLRTNMAPVFDAVALDNPYPATYFTPDAWNQMFLKAAFMARPLYRIQNIAERANADLSRMILDYVHERWSAGREVSPEIWQPCADFLSEDHMAALKKLAVHTEEIQRAVVELIREKNPSEALDGLALNLSKNWSWEKIGQEISLQNT